MNTALDFITDEVKRSNDTMARFIEGVGYSRASFYRAMKDCKQLTDADLDKFSRRLKLDPSRDKEFRRIVKLAALGLSGGNSNAFLDELLSGPQYTSLSQKEVECTTTGPARYRLIRTYRELVRGIFDTSDITWVQVQILNCVSDVALNALYAFILEMRNCIEEYRPAITVSFDHLVCADAMGDIDRLNMLFHMAYLVQLPDYAIAVKADRHVQPGAYDVMDNAVLVSVMQADELVNGYYFHITPGKFDRDHCMITNDMGFTNFFKDIFANYRKNAATEYRTLGAAALNAHIIQFEKPYKKLLMKRDFCLDNFTHQVWGAYWDRVFAMHSDELKRFRRKIDPQGDLQFLTDAAFYGLQKELLCKRFEANEHPGSVNIFTVLGIANFALSGVTKETVNNLPPFSKEERIMQLEYMRKRIDESYGDPDKQQFYFFRDATPELYVCAFANEGICMASEHSIDLINCNLLLQDRALSSLLYEMIAGALPGDIVLTKDDSLLLLSNIIETLKARK